MDTIEFGENRNLKKYHDSNGNTVKQLTGLINYMIQLISKKRLENEKFDTFYFILEDQWFSLTAHDMRSTLVNAVLENHRSQTTPGTPMFLVSLPSSSTPMTSPIHTELASFKKGIKREASSYSTLKDER